MYYTTGIMKTDPYTDSVKSEGKLCRGLRGRHPRSRQSRRPRPPAEEEETLREKIRKWIRRIPLIMALTVFIPIGVVAFLINSGVQTVRSARRVKEHEMALAGIDIKNYRVPLWVNGIREAVEDAYETINSSQRQDYLSLSGDEADGKLAGDEEEAMEQEIMALERKQSHARQPTLAPRAVSVRCHPGPGQPGLEEIPGLDTQGSAQPRGHHR